MQFFFDRNIFNTMNKDESVFAPDVDVEKLSRFMEIVDKLQQCCRERSAYISDKFDLPQAELRCLLAIGEQRYTTPGELAKRINVAKSRVTRLVDNLVSKKLVDKVTDPADSRVRLLTLTPDGQAKRMEVNDFTEEVGRLLLGQMDASRQDEVLENVSALVSCMRNVKDMIV